jgi:poly-gamma-glutamate biosynthesis protein PgsC/CapC
MIYEIFFIGLVIGFLYYEFVGISPGGVIAPAYFVMFVDQPVRILVTIVIAFIVWGVINFLAARFILFGRRKLLLALLLGFMLKLLVLNFIQNLSFITLDLQSIGYIIPGLIANELGRQKPLPTLASIGVVTSMTYLIFIMIR